MTKQELIDDAKARLLIAEHDLPNEAWQWESYDGAWFHKDFPGAIEGASRVRLTPSTFNLDKFKKGCPAFTRKGEKVFFRCDKFPGDWNYVMAWDKLGKSFSVLENGCHYDDGTPSELDLYRMEIPLQKPNKYVLAFEAGKKVQYQHDTEKHWVDYVEGCQPPLGNEFWIWRILEPHSEWKALFDQGVPCQTSIRPLDLRDGSSGWVD